ncbi:hypothetical protein ACC674_39405, partial [Rhizobium ruizarguesonis]
AHRRLRQSEAAGCCPQRAEPRDRQTLFQRTTDGFVLTDEGTAVFAGAERIEEEALAVERVIAGGSRQLDGFLRLYS